MSKRQYYKILETKQMGQEIQKLVRFDIPTRVGYSNRKKILDDGLDESGADALIEIYWTKGSIVKKNPFRFDAILVYTLETKASR